MSGVEIAVCMFSTCMALLIVWANRSGNGRQEEQEKPEGERCTAPATRADLERLRADIKATEKRLLGWQIGIGVIIVAILTKGFDW